MTVEKLIKDYLPMSESAYYILLSLTKATHGYGVIQQVQGQTGGKIKLGPGTVYGALNRFEKDGLIVPAGEEERRKLYRLTAQGQELLKLEVERLGKLYESGKHVLEGEAW